MSLMQPKSPFKNVIPFFIYYSIRRFIPRRVQIGLRRATSRLIRTVHRHDWPVAVRTAQKPAEFAHWPGGKRFVLVLRHDVESAVGHSRCGSLLELEHHFGLHSAFFFVPEGYAVDPALRFRITSRGGEIGVHGLKHDGMLYRSRANFRACAARINRYMHEWGSDGFSSPSSHHRLDWLHELNIRYDTSTFDTDPFEPQPDGIGTVFPLIIHRDSPRSSLIELPYTLPQDFTLFILLREESIKIWKQKLDWIIRHGGMVLLNTHPDYMQFPGDKPGFSTYSADLYRQFLSYVTEEYHDQYWAALPREVASYWRMIAGSYAKKPT
jgi:hypothetical protein